MAIAHYGDIAPAGDDGCPGRVERDFPGGSGRGRRSNALRTALPRRVGRRCISARPVQDRRVRLQRVRKGRGERPASDQRARRVGSHRREASSSRSAIPFPPRAGLSSTCKCRAPPRTTGWPWSPSVSCRIGGRRCRRRSYSRPPASIRSSPIRRKSSPIYRRSRRRESSSPRSAMVTSTTCMPTLISAKCLYVGTAAQYEQARKKQAGERRGGSGPGQPERPDLLGALGRLAGVLTGGRRRTASGLGVLRPTARGGLSIWNSTEY